MNTEPDALTTFHGIVSYEQAYRRATHNRSLISRKSKAIGVAWLPRSLDALPVIVGARVVEMQGPDNDYLLYVPFSILNLALRAGANQLGIAVQHEPLCAVLQDLDLESTRSPNPDALFDLIHMLTTTALTAFTQEHRIDFAALAPLYALLLPGLGEHLPEIVETQRIEETGAEQQILTVNIGNRTQRYRYRGLVFTAVPAEALRAEQSRVRRLRAALDAYSTELEAVIAMRTTMQ
jgi:hypothetical protein